MSAGSLDHVGFKYQSITGLLSRQYEEAWFLAERRREFLKKEYTRLPGFFREAVFTYIQAEVQRLQAFATPKDFVMPGLETPRVMSVVGGRTLLRESPTLWALYANSGLRGVVSQIVGGEVFPCLHPNEFMVINYLLAPGNTHGWHLDDPAYALVVVLEAPPAEEGGVLEFIPEWDEFCERQGIVSETGVETLVQAAQAAEFVQRRFHATGDVYLLRADRCLHRVTALQGGAQRRAVLNLAFEATPGPVYGQTANILYGDGEEEVGWSAS